MGFTLLEILITFGIILVLITVSIPITVSFFNNQDLENTSYQLVQSLRQAQNQAMAMEADSPFSVYLNNDFFCLFKGVDYQSRDNAFDLVVNIPKDITVSGLQQISFAKLTGLPNTVGWVGLSSSERTSTTTINEIGRVNLEL